ncbi:MAG: hypothetical protein IJ583_03510, partial [Firmicutes bacterium]|nr:hypothetical protein [Bacillota bacterium]
IGFPRKYKFILAGVRTIPCCFNDVSSGNFNEAPSEDVLKTITKIKKSKRDVFFILVSFKLNFDSTKNSA